MFFMFTGQGSQFVGMGQSFRQFKEMRLVLEEINDALSYDLSKLIGDGDGNVLRRTEYAQPAILAVSVGIVRVVGARFNIVPRFMAGHSAGEYSALHAAGAISLRDAACLLRMRGKAMQDACPEGYGKMVAILGLTYERVADVLKLSDTLCYAANDNGGKQVVISGEKAAVDDAVSELKKAGALRTVELSVSAPFHTPLISGAQDVMREALERVNIDLLSCPVISNVSALPYEDAAQIKKLLVEQIVAMVRWRETVEYVTDNGVKHYIEFGPAPVLSKLASKIVADSKSIAVCEENDLVKLEEFFNNV